MLTDAQAAKVRSLVEELEASGFKTVSVRLRPVWEVAGRKEEPLFAKIWPRLRVQILLDVPGPKEER